MPGVYELRQYTLRHGQRDVLVDLFDRHLVEPQEALGMQILGQFRDLDRHDRFVWLRGFRDMPARRESLDGFYSGPVWLRHREAANATMVDSDDVLLLRPLPEAATPFAYLEGVQRPPIAGTAPRDALISVSVYDLTQPPSSALRELFTDGLEPTVLAMGGTPVALLESETVSNNFPRLPVREGVHAVVHVVRYQSAEMHEEARRQMAESPSWRSLRRELTPHLNGEVHELRLEPTTRSLLR